MVELYAPANPVGANRLFEYCVARIPIVWATLTPDGAPVPALNTLGYYGWELVAILPSNDPTAPCGFFRRDLITTPPAVLTLTALGPDSAILGAPSFTLHVLGEGFTPDCVIVWNGADEPTAYVSATELTTGVNMATAEVALTLPVAVRKGTQTSNALPFTFTAP